MTTDLLSIATLILALVTALVAGAAWWQIRLSKKIASADLLVRLEDSFCSQLCYQGIIDKIEKKELTLNRQAQNDDVRNLDNYLAFFEVIEHCIDQHVIDENRAHRLYGYYVLKAMYYEPVRKYIMETADYWVDFRSLVNQMLPLEEKRRGFNREEVINYYTSK